MKIVSIYKQSKIARTNFLKVYLTYLYYKCFYKKSIVAHANTVIYGVNNIICGNQLTIGMNYVGFLHPKDKTVLNIQGKLYLKSFYSIGRGCRFDIAEGATVSIGSGGYVNAFTKFIIMHKLEIGNNCIIAWDCQFLDEDFHEVNYKNKKERD